MVLHKSELVPYQNLADPIAIEFDDLSCENELEEGNYLAIEERAKLNKRRSKKDDELDDSCDHDMVNDPVYELFLKSLKIHDNSYALDVEENGVRALLKYDGDSDLDNESNEEPRRKLRSSMNQKSRPENQVMIKFESEKGKSVKLSTKKVEWESGYRTFRCNFKVVNGYGALEFEGCTVEYEKMEEETNVEKEEDNDGSFSDVEYLYSTFDDEGNRKTCTIVLDEEENNHEKDECNDDYLSDEGAFGKEGKTGISMMNEDSSSYLKDVAKYREKIIAVLMKPYDQLEYERLLENIEFCRAGARHLELRNGRERSYSMKKEGKSYVDLYPELKRELLQVRHDKPKCLNLLRGFFFWLQNPRTWYPWEDAECLAIRPGSG